MKLLFTKQFRLLLPVVFGLAAVAGLAPTAQSQIHLVGRDSVVMSTAVGSSTYASIWIYQDTTLSTQPENVTASISGSSEFTIQADSVLPYAGYNMIVIRYLPTSSANSEAVLTIAGTRGDSVRVTLIGEPTRYVPEIQFSLGNYDSLVRKQQSCQDFGVYNPNPDAITVTRIVVSDNANGAQWSIENQVSLPVLISSHASLTLGQLCALLGTDSSDIYGTLQIFYTYDDSSFSAMTDLSGYGRPVNSVCVTASSGSFGQTDFGSSASKTITLQNTTGSSIYLDSEQITGGFSDKFTLNSPSFPLTIQAGQSVNLRITFNSDGTAPVGTYYADLSASVHGESPDSVPCNDLTIPLDAYVVNPVVDSITLDVPPGSSSLSIAARTTVSNHAIFIHNSGTSQITLESLEASSTDTSIALPYFNYYAEMIDNGIYDTLSPGRTYGPIIMTLQASDTGTYDIGLTLNYQVSGASRKGATPQSSLTYTVVAHRLPPLSAGVSEPNAPQPVAFTLSPNPAHGEVTIGLPEDGASNVEIYDVLGNLMFQGTERGTFVWNRMAAGSPVANGAYIVRVRKGSHVSSERLMLER